MFGIKSELKPNQNSCKTKKKIKELAMKVGHRGRQSYHISPPTYPVRPLLSLQVQNLQV